MSHTSTVTSIEHGRSNIGDDYALARLSCGHYGEVTLRSDLPCAGTFSPEPHNPEHQLTNVGDEMPCTECDKDASLVRKALTLDPSTLRYARYRRMAGGHCIYQADPTSPTGVCMAGMVPDTPAGRDALVTLGLTRLSPTEGR